MVFFHNLINRLTPPSLPSMTRGFTIIDPLHS